MAVRKALKSGKIVESVDYTNPKRPLIDPIKAAKEWGKNYDPSYERTGKISENIKLPDTVVDHSDPEAPMPHPAQGGRSLADIKRQTAEVKLRLAAVDLKEKQGHLVDKDLVFRSLFAAGQEMRTAMQAIPDRCIDMILAAKDRNEAHVILYTEITNALERLHEIYKRGLNDGNDED
jgi:hypothetical protein